MKLQANITINGRTYTKGSEVPWYNVYPFFMIHMLIFGGSGFLMAYGPYRPSLVFLYFHGGVAIATYTTFYTVLFGVDEVEWMFINAGLGVLGIYGQVGWVLSKFGKEIGDYPFYVTAVPLLYYVLYTFLLRHAFLDATGAHEDADRKQKVQVSYVVGSVAVSVLLYVLQRR